MTGVYEDIVQPHKVPRVELMPKSNEPLRSDSVCVFVVDDEALILMTIEHTLE